MYENEKANAKNKKQYCGRYYSPGILAVSQLAYGYTCMVHASAPLQPS